jgi:hypothetical protein
MDTSADRVAQTEDDAAALATRRLTLRAYADRIARIVEGLDLPETFLEAERAARAITAADRLIQQLPNIPEDQDGEAEDTPVVIKPPRRRLRAFADQLLKVIGYIADPDSFLEGERAGRCLLATDRMLSQLYEAPKANARFPKSPAFADDDLDEEESPYPSGKDWQLDLQNRVDRMTKAHARNCGIWPDGSPCIPGTPEPAHPFNEADRAVLLRISSEPVDPLASDRLTALIITGRANAVTRARARLDGRWPDNSPYRDTDPDFYDISARFDENVLKLPPPDTPPTHVETIGPCGFPAWLVRKHPPPHANGEVARSAEGAHLTSPPHFPNGEVSRRSP